MMNHVRARTFGVAVALSFLGAGCSNGSDGDAAAAPLEVGQPSPAYVARSVTGDAVSIGGLRGKVVLLNAWATWCKPCRVEIPLIRALHGKYATRGLQVVG